MSVSIEWNEDKTKATISKEDLEKLQGSFDKGFAKGKENALNDLLKHFDFLNIDSADLSGSAAKLKKQFEALDDPKKMAEMMKDKIKDLDIVKDLQTKLEAQSKKFDSLKGEYDGYQRKILIDQALQTLATTQTDNRKKAINPVTAIAAFRGLYQVDVKNGQAVILTPEGNPMFDGVGKEVSVAQVFDQFAGAHPYLFEGSATTGSGGQSPKDSAVRSYKDLKTDAAKAEYIQKHGRKAYQDLVDNEAAAMQK